MKHLPFAVMLFLLSLSSNCSASTAYVVAANSDGTPYVWGGTTADPYCSTITGTSDCVQAVEVRDTTTGITMGEITACSPAAGNYCGGTLKRPGNIKPQFGPVKVQCRIRYVGADGVTYFTPWIDSRISGSDALINFQPGQSVVK